jgi:hypothetical protein
MISRPDEQVLEGDIRKAGERTNNLKSAVGSVGKIAAGAAGLGAASMGAKGLSKILPFLSEYIPVDLAYKGINKVMPGVGTFLKDGMKQGLSLKSGLDFIKEQVSQSQQNEQAKKKGNIIEQYSPELLQFMSQLIQKGANPLEAASKAQMSSKFLKPIQNMVKDHKVPFFSIVESIFGNGKTAQPDQMDSEIMNPQQANEVFGMNQPSGNSGQMGQMGQNQPQTGDEAIMAAFEKLMKM